MQYQGAPQAEIRTRDRRSRARHQWHYFPYLFIKTKTYFVNKNSHVQCTSYMYIKKGKVSLSIMINLNENIMISSRAIVDERYLQVNKKRSLSPFSSFLHFLFLIYVYMYICRVGWVDFVLYAFAGCLQFP